MEWSEENVDATETIDQGLIEEQELNETNPQIQTRRYTALHINTHEPSLFPGYTDLTSSTYQKDGELDMPPGYYEAGISLALLLRFSLNL